MMENNSYVLEEDAILVPNIDLRKCAETQIQMKNEREVNVTIENATQTMFELKFREEKENIKHPQRCYFRNIDEEHPSK